jgi:hypothetical protein
VAVPSTAAVVGDGIERYSDRFKPSAAPEKVQLSAFLTLDDRYFPAELYTRCALAPRGLRAALRGSRIPGFAG